MEHVYNQLISFLQPQQLLTQVSMKEHTSMRVGGEAVMLVLPYSVAEIKRVLQVLVRAHVSHTIIGNGTNLIVSDHGYSGVILKLADNFAAITVCGDQITAQSGASLAAVSNAAYRAGLTGFEFASGIPGTIGGAVAMNAGAYDGEMKDVVIKTTAIGDNCEMVHLSGEEHEFGYRESLIQKQNLIVLETTIKLETGEADKIKEKMQSLNARRREKQPLNLPSAGSVFKRPADNFAGKLIEQAGLRGVRIGGAQISDRHCGFIVNTGDATAADVIALIELVKDKVFQSSGVMLEEEVKILGG
ncbi:MAG: UDP-N-acetylmuramate dehydrogenase [Thermoclostridium sp.]|nr:UDP-N-acetylmuramate dehydrogenase [Thermoclostridium sp.]